MKREVTGTAESTPDTPTSSKKTYEEATSNIAENVWRSIFFVLVLVLGWVLHRVYLFQTSLDYSEHCKGRPVDFLYSIIVAVIFHKLEDSIESRFEPWIANEFLRLDRYKSIESRERRVRQLSTWIFTFFYYLASSISAYVLLRGTSALPSWLGGQGQCANLYINTPYLTEDNLAMKIFYIVSFGKHLNHFITHTFLKPQSKYYEYVLHHGISCFLIAFSYLMNQWIVGLMILLTHDLSDTILVIRRSYADYRYRNPLLLTFFSTLVVTSWITFRVVVFNMCCLYPIYELFWTIMGQLTPSQIDIILIPSVFMIALMAVLDLLNLYWTYHIYKVAVEPTKTTEDAKKTTQ